MSRTAGCRRSHGCFSHVCPTVPACNVYLCVFVYLCICIFICFVFLSFSSTVMFSRVSSYILCLFICVLNRPFHISVYICLFIILIIQQSCILLFILVFFSCFRFVYLYTQPSWPVMCVMCICVCIVVGVNANFVCSIITDA